MNFQVKDLVFVRGSRVLHQIPLIVVDIYRFTSGDDYIILDPRTGIRYSYQGHELVGEPC